MSDLRVLKAAGVVGVHEAQVWRAAEALHEEQERQAAVAAAYAQGYDDGRAREQQSAQGADLRGAQALEDLVQAARAQHAEQVCATSRAVLAAALDVTEWVLRHELPHDSRSVLARLEEAAAALMPSPEVRVLVSAADEAAVRTWASGQRGVEVVVDPSLRAGDAAYETDTGSVDVSVGAALRVAAEALGVDVAGRPA